MFELIHVIMHLFRVRQYKSERSEADLLAQTMTHMEAKALGFFAHRPGATQRDLVQHSGRDKAQVTRLVQGLRDKGLIEAQSDPADRRSTRLYLTAPGETVAAEIRSQREKVAMQALSGLSTAERDQLGALLVRVQANLRGEDHTA